MPVQFRCSLCRKKLKVSRRKSGSDVACPNCGGYTTVPKASDMDEELDQFLSTAGSVATVPAPPKPKSKKIPKVKPQPQQKLNDLPLFEREDFAELLEKDDKETVEFESAPENAREAAPVTRVVDADAVVMSRSTVTMYVIAVVSLLGLAFAAGFLVGSK